MIENARIEGVEKDTGQQPVFPRPKQQPKRNSALIAELKATCMASLPFIGFLVFTLFPMGLSLIVSFSNLYSYKLDSMEFLGFSKLLGNYKKVLLEPDTLLAFGNSMKYCISVPINISISLLLAHLTSRHMVGTKFIRVILFVPSVCIGTAVAFIWQAIFMDNMGILNGTIIKLGGNNVGFLSTKGLFMPSIVIMSMWITGTNIIAMQAALSSVSPTLKEAAKIDGAPEIVIFWKIIFPMITPTLFYMLIMNFIAAMQEQGLMQLLSGANGTGPGKAAVTLSYQVYRFSFGPQRLTYGLGVGCALSWLIAIFIMLVVKLLFWVSDKWVSYESD